MVGYKEFVRESNRIEGITREPSPLEVDSFTDFIGLTRIEVVDLIHLVSVFQPGARLRWVHGLNVRVGNHIAPPGGPGILEELRVLLDDVNALVDPFYAHVRYETLHPFTDGNGRSGRAIWAWQMERVTGGYGLALGFLHAFYYQSLAATRAEAPGDAGAGA